MKIKRILAFVLACTMLLGNCMSVFAEEMPEPTSVVQDIDENNVDEEQPTTQEQIVTPMPEVTPTIVPEVEDEKYVSNEEQIVEDTPADKLLTVSNDPGESLPELVDEDGVTRGYVADANYYVKIYPLDSAPTNWIYGDETDDIFSVSSSEKAIELTARLAEDYYVYLFINADLDYSGNALSGFDTSSSEPRLTMGFEDNSSMNIIGDAELQAYLQHSGIGTNSEVYINDGVELTLRPVKQDYDPNSNGLEGIYTNTSFFINEGAKLTLKGISDTENGDVDFFVLCNINATDGLGNLELCNASVSLDSEELPKFDNVVIRNSSDKKHIGITIRGSKLQGNGLDIQSGTLVAEQGFHFKQATLDRGELQIKDSGEHYLGDLILKNSYLNGHSGINSVGYIFEDWYGDYNPTPLIVKSVINEMGSSLQFLKGTLEDEERLLVGQLDSSDIGMVVLKLEGDNTISPDGFVVRPHLLNYAWDKNGDIYELVVTDNNPRNIAARFGNDGDFKYFSNFKQLKKWFWEQQEKEYFGSGLLINILGPVDLEGDDLNYDGYYGRVNIYLKNEATINVKDDSIICATYVHGDITSDGKSIIYGNINVAEGKILTYKMLSGGSGISEMIFKFGRTGKFIVDSNTEVFDGGVKFTNGIPNLEIIGSPRIAVVNTSIVVNDTLTLHAGNSLSLNGDKFLTTKNLEIIPDNSTNKFTFYYPSKLKDKSPLTITGAVKSNGCNLWFSKVASSEYESAEFLPDELVAYTSSTFPIDICRIESDDLGLVKSGSLLKVGKSNKHIAVNYSCPEGNKTKKFEKFEEIKPFLSGIEDISFVEIKIDENLDMTDAAKKALDFSDDQYDGVPVVIRIADGKKLSLKGDTVISASSLFNESQKTEKIGDLAIIEIAAGKTFTYKTRGGKGLGGIDIKAGSNAKIIYDAQGEDSQLINDYVVTYSAGIPNLELKGKFVYNYFANKKTIFPKQVVNVINTLTMDEGTELVLRGGGTDTFVVKDVDIKADYSTVLFDGKNANDVPLKITGKLLSSGKKLYLGEREDEKAFGGGEKIATVTSTEALFPTNTFVFVGNNENCAAYRDGNFIKCGKKTFALFKLVNEEYVHEAEFEYSKWSEVINRINTLNDKSDYVVQIICDGEPVWLDSAFTMPKVGAANSLSIEYVIDEAEFDDTPLQQLYCVGAVALTCDLTLTNIELLQQKSVNERIIAAPKNISLGKYSATFYNCNVPAAGITSLAGSNLSLYWGTLLTSTVSSTLAGDVLLNGATIDMLNDSSLTMSGTVTLGDNESRDSGIISATGNLIFNNIVSNSSRNIISFGRVGKLGTLTINGTVSTNLDDGPAFYAPVFDGESTRFEFCAPSASYARKISPAAIWVDGHYANSIVSVKAPKVSADYIMVTNRVYDESFDFSNFDATVRKEGDKLIEARPTNMVELWTFSNSEELEEPTSELVGLFTNIEYAYKEIDRLNDINANYCIRINGNDATLFASGNTWVRKDVNLPTKAKSVRIEGKESDEKIEYNFNSTIKANTEIELSNIVLHPAKTAATLDVQSNFARIENVDTFGNTTLAFKGNRKKANTNASFIDLKNDEQSTFNIAGISNIDYLFFDGESSYKVNGDVNVGYIVLTAGEVGSTAYSVEIGGKITADCVEYDRPQVLTALGENKINDILIRSCVSDAYLEVGGKVTVDKKTGLITKYDPTTTINGSIVSDDTEMNSLLHVTAFRNDTKQIVDSDGINWASLKNFVGVAKVKNLTVNNVRVYLDNQNTDYGVLATKKSGVLGWANLPLAVSLYADNEKIGVYENIQDAVIEINSLKTKRDYTLELNELSGRIPADTLAMPGAANISSLCIRSDNDSQSAILNYNGNISLTCPTEFKNIDFVQCKKFTTEAINIAVKIGVVQNEFVYDNVSFNTPVILSGVRKSGNNPGSIVTFADSSVDIASISSIEKIKLCGTNVYDISGDTIVGTMVLNGVDVSVGGKLTADNLKFETPQNLVALGDNKIGNILVGIGINNEDVINFEFSGNVTVDKKTNKITKYVPKTTINGEFINDTGNNVVLNIAAYRGDTKNKVDCTDIDWSSLKNFIGVVNAKNLYPDNVKIDVDGRDSLEFAHVNGATKKSGVIGLANLPLAVSLYADNEKIGIYENIQDAVIEINGLKTKRDYILELNELSVRIPADTLAMPGAANISSLCIRSDNDSQSAILNYNGNISLTCPTEFKNIDFVQCAKTASNSETLKPFTIVKVSAANNPISLSNVIFNTATLFDGGGKGVLNFNGPVEASNGVNPAEDGTVLIEGTITKFASVNFEQAMDKMYLLPYATSATKIANPEFMITELNIDDVEICVGLDDPMPEDTNDIKANSKCTVDKLSLKNALLVVAGDLKVKTLNVDASELISYKAFEVSGDTTVSSESLFGSVFRDNKKGSKTYLTLNGKVNASDDGIQVMILNPAGSKNIESGEPIQYTPYSYVSQNDQFSNSVLTAKNATPDIFCLSPFCVDRYDKVTPENSKDVDNGYFLRKVGAEIVVATDDDIKIAVAKSSEKVIFDETGMHTTSYSEISDSGLYVSLADAVKAIDAYKDSNAVYTICLLTDNEDVNNTNSVLTFSTPSIASKVYVTSFGNNKNTLYYTNALGLKCDAEIENIVLAPSKIATVNKVKVFQPNALAISTGKFDLVLKNVDCLDGYTLGKIAGDSKNSDIKFVDCESLPITEMGSVSTIMLKDSIINVSKSIAAGKIVEDEQDTDSEIFCNNGTITVNQIVGESNDSNMMIHCQVGALTINGISGIATLGAPALLDMKTTATLKAPVVYKATDGKINLTNAQIATVKGFGCVWPYAIDGANLEPSITVRNGKVLGDIVWYNDKLYFVDMDIADREVFLEDESGERVEVFMDINTMSTFIEKYGQADDDYYCEFSNLRPLSIDPNIMDDYYAKASAIKLPNNSSTKRHNSLCIVSDDSVTLNYSGDMTVYGDVSFIGMKLVSTDAKKIYLKKDKLGKSNLEFVSSDLTNCSEIVGCADIRTVSTLKFEDCETINLIKDVSKLTSMLLKNTILVTHGTNTVPLDPASDGNWDRLAYPTKVSFTTTSIKGKTGDVIPLSYTVAPENGDTELIEWVSSDKSIVSVSKEGELKLLKTGRVTISAKYNSRIISSNTLEVIVNFDEWYEAQTKVNPTKVVFNTTMVSGDSLDEIPLDYTASPANANIKIIEWVSTNEAVATIDEKGEIVLGDVAGKTIIKACFNGKLISDNFVEVTVNPIEGKILNVLDYGANIEDTDYNDAPAINSAIANGNGKTVYLPAGVYNIDTAHYRSFIRLGTNTPATNVNLLLDDNAILKPLDGNYHYNQDEGNGTSRIIDVQHATGCTISGGKIIGRRDQDTSGYKPREYYHGILVTLTKNTTIANMTICDNYGDGIYLGDEDDDEALVNENISIVNCNITNNRRNNISITRGSKYIIDRCTITKANGISPQFGICIEPEHGSGLVVKDVVIANSTIKENAKKAYSIQNTCIGFTVINCTISGDRDTYAGKNVVIR